MCSAQKEAVSWRISGVVKEEEGMGLCCVCVFLCVYVWVRLKAAHQVSVILLVRSGGRK
jgi:hypothetical protein